MKHHVVFLLCFSFAFIAISQKHDTHLKVIWEKELSSLYVLTGSVSPLNDTSVVLTASGGLLLLNPDFWIPPVDSQSYIVSSFYNAAFHFNLVSNYDPDQRKSHLLWYDLNLEKSVGDTLAVLDSMICFVEGGDGVILVYGEKKSRHFIYQLTIEGLFEVFSSAIPPTQIQLLDKNTFLVSYYDKILFCQRGVEPYIFYQYPGQKEILGFQQTPDHRFYISSEDGIFQLSNGKLILLYAGAKGKLKCYNQSLFVLDAESNRVTLLSGT